MNVLFFLTEQIFVFPFSTTICSSFIISFCSLSSWYFGNFKDKELTSCHMCQETLILLAFSFNFFSFFTFNQLCTRSKQTCLVRRFHKFFNLFLLIWLASLSLKLKRIDITAFEVFGRLLQCNCHYRF